MDRRSHEKWLHAFTGSRKSKKSMRPLRNQSGCGDSRRRSLGSFIGWPSDHPYTFLRSPLSICSLISQASAVISAQLDANARTSAINESDPVDQTRRIIFYG